MVQFNNILIIKWGAFGDFIASTPTIRAIRAAFPQGRITLLTDGKGMEICPPGAIVDHVINYTSFENSFSLVSSLRKLRLDLAINLKWSSERAFIVTWLAGRRTAGGGHHWWRRFYDYPAPLRQDGETRHEYHKNLDIVEFLGLPKSYPEAFIYRGPEDLASVHAYLGQLGVDKAPLLLIAPGASKAEKRWAPDRFAEVGRRFVREHAGRVVVSWGPGEEHLAREVAALIGSGAFVAFRTTYRQVAALVERADFCVCNNSGIMHVAHAMGTPYVCLNTSISWAPYPPVGIGVNAYSEENTAKLGMQRTMSRTLVDVYPDEVWDALVKHFARPQH